MRLVVAEPSIVPTLDTVTFHCDECGADTKREIEAALALAWLPIAHDVELIEALEAQCGIAMTSQLTVERQRRIGATGGGDARAIVFIGVSVMPFNTSTELTLVLVR